jgi:hypothetical protein
MTAPAAQMKRRARHRQATNATGVLMIKPALKILTASFLMEYANYSSIQQNVDSTISNA